MKVATVWLLELVVKAQVPVTVISQGAGSPDIRRFVPMIWAGAGKVSEKVDSSRVVVSITWSKVMVICPPALVHSPTEYILIM